MGQQPPSMLFETDEHIWDCLPYCNELHGVPARWNVKQQILYPHQASPLASRSCNGIICFNQCLHLIFCKAVWNPTVHPTHRRLMDFLWAIRSHIGKSWIQCAANKEWCEAVMINSTTHTSSKREEYRVVSSTQARVIPVKSNDTLSAVQKPGQSQRIGLKDSKMCYTREGRSKTRKFK